MKTTILAKDYNLVTHQPEDDRVVDPPLLAHEVAKKLMDMFPEEPWIYEIHLHPQRAASMEYVLRITNRDAKSTKELMPRALKSYANGDPDFPLERIRNWVNRTG